MQPNDLDAMHAMDGMAHASSYLRGSIGCRIDSQNRHVLLVVRVEVGPVMWPADLDEHANDNAEES
jgi:hypothetical protein